MDWDHCVFGARTSDFPAAAIALRPAQGYNVGSRDSPTSAMERESNNSAERGSSFVDPKLMLW
jgi:hypothetical protein